MHDHELKEKCREIARRDRVLRPQTWISLAALVIVFVLFNGGPLPESMMIPIGLAVCAYAGVVNFLWVQNLYCPVCSRKLLGRIPGELSYGFYLPDAHICRHCGTKLVFTEQT